MVPPALQHNIYNFIVLLILSFAVEQDSKLQSKLKCITILFCDEPASCIEYR